MKWADVIRYQREMSADGQESTEAAWRENSVEKRDVFDTEIKYNVYILCETGDMQRVLKMLFQIDIPEGIHEGECHYYSIMRGYVPVFEKNGENLRIDIPHPFPNKIFSILIADRIDRNRALQSFELFQLKKDPDPFELLLIRNKCRITECGERELKDRLFQVKYHYDLNTLKKAVEEQGCCGNIRSLVDSFMRDMGEAIPYELVPIVRNNLDSEIHITVEQCKNCIMGYFHKELSGILEYFLKKDDFVDNFVYTAIYLDEVEKAKKEVDAYCRKKIRPLIENALSKAKETKTEALETELFNLISGDHAIADINARLLKEMVGRIVSRMEAVLNESG